MIDYQALLKKYIDHVGTCEGTTFMKDWYRQFSQAGFTDEEWAELQRLDQEILEEYRRK